MGSLIWGKLPGYDWWPGNVMSYGKKDKTGMEADDKEEDDDEEEEEEEEEVEIAWVKWYGDNQLSQVSTLLYQMLIAVDRLILYHLF